MITALQEREILRLASLGTMSHRNIGRRMNVAQVTVSKVIERGYVREDRARIGPQYCVKYCPTLEEIEAGKRDIRERKGESLPPTPREE